ncbi:MAG: metallophosphoesterase [Bacteroidales bacterium]|nr:metallophosphoesterase [Bacteroidales bacterium]
MRKIVLLLSLVLALMGCADKPYVIVQIADAQLGFTAADKSKNEGTEYVNDLTYEIDCLTKAVMQVNEMKPDAVIFTGDQVHRYYNEEQWNTFAEVISAIDPSIKVLHIPGNHDVIIGEGTVDSSPFTDRYGEDRFVLCERGVRLVGINSNLVKYDDPEEESQYGWLNDVLNKENEDEVTIVFSHHPFFLGEIDEEDGYFQIQKSKRQRYFDLCKEKDVDALYAGHLHNNSSGEYSGIPVRTTTSVAFQIGEAQPSIRVITITDDTISDRLLNI